MVFSRPEIRWHWIVDDGFPPEPDDEWFQEYLVMDESGNFSVGFWREDAKAWDSCIYGWLEEHYTLIEGEGPYFGTVVAWCPVPWIIRNKKEIGDRINEKKNEWMQENSGEHEKEGYEEWT